MGKPSSDYTLRAIDSQGRIVLPSSFRKQLGIVSPGTVAVAHVGDSLIISATRPHCSACLGESGNLYHYANIALCATCREALLRLLPKFTTLELP